MANSVCSWLSCCCAHLGMHACEPHPSTTPVCAATPLDHLPTTLLSHRDRNTLWPSRMGASFVSASTECLLAALHCFRSWHHSQLKPPCIPQKAKALFGGESVLFIPFGDLCCRAGIDLATVEVRMNQLKVEANIAVGSRGNPTVTNTVLNIADVRLSTSLQFASTKCVTCVDTRMFGTSVRVIERCIMNRIVPGAGNMPSPSVTKVWAGACVTS